MCILWVIWLVLFVVLELFVDYLPCQLPDWVNIYHIFNNFTGNTLGQIGVLGGIVTTLTAMNFPAPILI
jgi:hypothetical protein